MEEPLPRRAAQTGGCHESLADRLTAAKDLPLQRGWSPQSCHHAGDIGPAPHPWTRPQSRPVDNAREPVDNPDQDRRNCPQVEGFPGPTPLNSWTVALILGSVAVAAGFDYAVGAG